MQQAGRRRPRALMGAVAVLLALAPMLVLASPTSATVADDPQPVADGLRVENHATFTVDTTARVVHVRNDITVTNTKPASARGYYYLPTIGLPVGAEATNLAATRDSGTVLSVTTHGTDEEWLSIAVITLSPALVSGQTQTIALTYDLPGQPARSIDTTRFNDAAVAFIVYVVADPGLGSVRVVVPKALDVQVAGDSLTRADQPDGTLAYTADAIADPARWGAGIVATDDSKLLTSDPHVPGKDIEVRGWPDDRAWVDFIDGEIGKGLPVLEELVSLPWPKRVRPLQITETVSPYLYGYAGWYSVDDDEIDVGDELDDTVIIHELSHIWFNDKLFSDRWVDEGLAEEYASEVVARLDGAAAAMPLPIDQTSPVAQPLEDWQNPSFTREDDHAREDYGYNASWAVMHDIVTEVGTQKMATVFAAAAHEEIPYVGDDTPESYFGGAVDWRGLLDLIDERTGSTKADALFATYVASASDQDALSRRLAARQQYAVFVAASGAWSAPADVRRAMARWDFGGAQSAEDDAKSILAVRDEMAATLAPLKLTVPSALEHTYETASLSEARAEADADLQAANDLVDAAKAVHRSHDPLATFGLLGGAADRALRAAERDLARGDGAAAIRGARHARRLVADAHKIAALRFLAVLLVVAIAALATRVLRRWRARRHEPPAVSPSNPYA